MRCGGHGNRCERGAGAHDHRCSSGDRRRGGGPSAGNKCLAVGRPRVLRHAGRSRGASKLGDRRRARHGGREVGGTFSEWEREKFAFDGILGSSVVVQASVARALPDVPRCHADHRLTAPRSPSAHAKRAGARCARWSRFSPEWPPRRGRDDGRRANADHPTDHRDADRPPPPAPFVLAARASTRHTSGIAIEIPSVKRRPASSPHMLFLGLPSQRFRSSERSSRCCSAFCSRSPVGREGPGA